MALRENRTTDTWSIAEAKAKFSEVIERAKTEGPQRVTKNGRAAVVVVAADEWDQRAGRTANLAEFFHNSPLRGSGIDLRRDKTPPRDTEL